MVEKLFSGKRILVNIYLSTGHKIQRQMVEDTYDFIIKELQDSAAGTISMENSETGKSETFLNLKHVIAMDIEETVISEKENTCGTWSIDKPNSYKNKNGLLGEWDEKKEGK